MLPVRENVPVSGLNNSALPSSPLTTSTLPSLSKIARWPVRGACMLPVGVSPELTTVTVAVALSAGCALEDAIT